MLSSKLSFSKSKVSEFDEMSVTGDFESHSVTNDCNNSQCNNLTSIWLHESLSSGSKFSHIRSQYALHTSSVSIDVLVKWVESSSLDIK